MYLVLVHFYSFQLLPLTLAFFPLKVLYPRKQCPGGLEILVVERLLGKGKALSSISNTSKKKMKKETMFFDRSDPDEAKMVFPNTLETRYLFILQERLWLCVCLDTRGQVNRSTAQ